jgi:hypothetical protein
MFTRLRVSQIGQATVAVFLSDIVVQEGEGVLIDMGLIVIGTGLFRMCPRNTLLQINKVLNRL